MLHCTSSPQKSKPSFLYPPTAQTHSKLAPPAAPKVASAFPVAPINLPVATWSREWQKWYIYLSLPDPTRPPKLAPDTQATRPPTKSLTVTMKFAILSTITSVLAFAVSAQAQAGAGGSATIMPAPGATDSASSSAAGAPGAGAGAGTATGTAISVLPSIPAGPGHSSAPAAGTGGSHATGSSVAGGGAPATGAGAGTMPANPGAPTKSGAATTSARTSTSSNAAAPLVAGEAGAVAALLGGVIAAVL
ncbi:hypothetical protein LshimejAT787_0410700 [Lyophyllum shimeji]|uniref:Uncharacterized protein n=1 Tax=Lyophyllum shimeji TaxID=47721 RepID=A0A9P3UKE6_LYOSH|nr:hypothetical protein LshimejAT787_0410700 [Lyophyllum shimeji]